MARSGSPSRSRTPTKADSYRYSRSEPENHANAPAQFVRYDSRMLAALLARLFPQMLLMLRLLEGLAKAVAETQGDVRTVLQLQRKEELMNEETRTILTRIDGATNNIAEELRRLRDNVKTGMTADEVRELQRELENRALKLEAIGKPDDPTGDAATQGRIG
jgi:hypothetical protein